MTADVVSWLTATFDEVEREAHARAALIPSLSALAGSHPRVVLAGVEADRAILAEHELVPGRTVMHIGRLLGRPGGTHGCRICDDWDGLIIASDGCRTVLLVASRYRHRPGYDETWRPE